MNIFNQKIFLSSLALFASFEVKRRKKGNPTKIYFLVNVSQNYSFQPFPGLDASFCLKWVIKILP
jgi:hypothetical protein